MANSLFSRPRSPPTTKKLRESELARIWSSASYYLGEQLALYQAVSIPGLGTFTVIRELVASQQNNTVAVHRPVFLLAKALAQDNDLQYDFIDDAEPDPYYELPYDEIASENGIYEDEAQLCVERTLCLFSACIGKRQNVAFIWRDVGMLLIEGRRVQMKFYEDFLGKLNGTADKLQALLGMPEMSKLVISRNDCAASQTSSGHVIVFPMYTHESILQMSETAKVDLKYHLKIRHEQGWSRAGDRGRKGDLCETRLLHRAALSPEKLPALTVMPRRDQKAEEKDARAGFDPTRGSRRAPLPQAATGAGLLPQPCHVQVRGRGGRSHTTVAWRRQQLQPSVSVRGRDGGRATDEARQSPCWWGRSSARPAPKGRPCPEPALTGPADGVCNPSVTRSGVIMAQPRVTAVTAPFKLADRTRPPHISQRGRRDSRRLPRSSSRRCCALDELLCREVE
ncbi:uncharacterized protein LOC116652929 [Coturnix japonica]|uniref:uncharacterized protein LOC116652929 n=1 Tax=Coturnix japonica TaxID=93934 RepID=UPI0013A5BE1C|nr:uncharacterized protein LOC116652929 [Coturnix japonica]